jgi:hypothetical protein
MGRLSVPGILTLVRFIVSVLARRFRSRVFLELEVLANRHQLHVLSSPKAWSTGRSSD